MKRVHNSLHLPTTTLLSDRRQPGDCPFVPVPPGSRALLHMYEAHKTFRR